MITKPIINYHCTRAFALAGLLEVVYERVFEAVNEGTDDPEAVLERAKTPARPVNAESEAIPQSIKNAIENIAAGEHNECVQQLYAELQPYLAPAWTWSATTPPPTGENVLEYMGSNGFQLDSFDSDRDWTATPGWYLRIPPALASIGDLYSLGLPGFAGRILRENGVYSVNHLTSLTHNDLLKLSKVGSKTLNAIKKALSVKGLSLAQGGKS